MWGCSVSRPSWESGRGGHGGHGGIGLVGYVNGNRGKGEPSSITGCRTGGGGRRSLPWVLGIFVTVWGVVTFVTEHNGWRTGWSLFVAALGLIVILVFEMVRTKIRHKRGLVSPGSNPNGSAPQGRKQPHNMDSFNELREATRPSPLTDPVTAFENRLERFNEGVVWKHQAETQATEETTTKRTRSVSGSRSANRRDLYRPRAARWAEEVLVLGPSCRREPRAQDQIRWLGRFAPRGRQTTDCP